MRRLFAAVVRFVRGGPATRRLLRHKVVFRIVGRATPFLAVDTEYGSFILDAHDRGPAESMYAHRAFDDVAVLTTAIATARRRGRLPDDLGDLTFVDVGANIGSTTVAAINLVGFGHVLALEPAPQNRRVLRANVGLNELQDQVTVVAAAVADRAGVMTMWLGSENHGDHRLWHREGMQLQHMSDSIEVPVMVLDDVVGSMGETTGRVGLVWIDTQGFEGAVLAGGHETLAAGVVVVAEFWPTGMKAAGTWERFRSIVARAELVQDLRTGDCFEAVDEALLDRLAERYDGSSVYSDLLFWFPTAPA